MAGPYKPVGVDADSLFPPRVEARLAEAYVAVGELTYNVRDYGAIGDGVVDDTLAVVAALNAANDAGGGVVFLPYGVYKITRNIGIGSNTTLRGAGFGSVLKGVWTSTSYNRIIGNKGFTVATDANITLEDFTLDYLDNGGQHGMMFRGVSGLAIRRLKIIGDPTRLAGACSIGGLSSTALGICKNVIIEQCEVHDASNFGFQLGYVDGVVVRGNVFDNCYREAIGIEPDSPGSSANGVNIMGNVFRRSPSTGPGTETGVVVVTTSSGYPVRDVCVGHNVIDIVGSTNYGINVIGGDSVVVAGNVVRGGSIGIKVGAAGFTSNKPVRVEGNNIVDPATTGVSLRNASKVTVKNNSVAGTTLTAGMQESDSSNMNVITDNDFVDANVATVTVVGASTIQGNNRDITGLSPVTTGP